MQITPVVTIGDEVPVQGYPPFIVVGIDYQDRVLVRDEYGYVQPIAGVEYRPPWTDSDPHRPLPEHLRS